MKNFYIGLAFVLVLAVGFGAGYLVFNEEPVKCPDLSVVCPDHPDCNLSCGELPECRAMPDKTQSGSDPIRPSNYVPTEQRDNRSGGRQATDYSNGY